MLKNYKEKMKTMQVILFYILKFQGLSDALIPANHPALS